MQNGKRKMTTDKSEIENLIANLRDKFRAVFHAEAAFIVRAPGRVNLLGEHVDYNDGWVMPAAIDRAAYLAVGPGDAGVVSLAAVDLGETESFRLAELDAKRGLSGEPLKQWALYPAGVAWALQARGLAVGGLQAALTADVRGAGLSRSAAIELAYAVAWQKLGGWSLAPLEMARLCQLAENKYVGVNCGLMDQFASACGQAGQVLVLDCRTLEWETVPLPAHIAVVIADTNVRRELGSSEYNLRRAQCEEAVRLLAAPLPGIRALRDVSVADFDRHAHVLSPLVQKRARYVVEECARTRQAVQRLRASDVAEFGELMNACHLGLRDLYEVSCPELDAMVEAAQRIEGCYGARLTGAGFGGCTVNLVAAPAAEYFRRELETQYLKATGRPGEIFVCQAGDGAKVISQ
jgi:galactokinase